MKRVLYLIKGLGRGGAEQLLLESVGHLDRSTFAYEVAYLLPHKNALVPEIKRSGIPVHCLDGGRGTRWVGRLRSLVGEKRIDLIHSHSPYAAIGARLALPRRHRPRMVYTEHGIWDFYRRATYWGNLLTFPRNDHVFAVSEFMRSFVRYPPALRFLRMPPVETLYHGLDLSSIHGWPSPEGVRRELGIPEHAPLVGTIANFRLQKRHSVLVRAAALIHRKMPETRFVLVGVGPLEADVRREVRELGLDGAVVFAGRRDDAPRVTASLDVFALPSAYEGLSIALLEAMALERPIVATRVGGNTELVRHDREGLLVPPDDPPALAQGILKLLTDRSLGERLGMQARDRAMEFDIRRAVRRQEEVYRFLTEGKKPVDGSQNAPHEGRAS